MLTWHLVKQMVLQLVNPNHNMYLFVHHGFMVNGLLVH